MTIRRLAKGDPRVEVDRLVRHVLGVRPKETIQTAAYRAIALEPEGSTRWLVATEILRPGEPWARMFAAAKLAKPRLVKCP